MPMICIDENFMKEYMLGEKVIYDNCGKTDSFIKTGVTEIDERCGGLQRGYTYLITSRPGMGKTAFVFNIWAHLLKDTSHFYRTVIFSWALQGTGGKFFGMYYGSGVCNKWKLSKNTRTGKIPRNP